MNPEVDYTSNYSRLLLERSVSACVAILLMCFAAAISPAQTFTVLHRFDTNAMGVHPYAPLTQAPDGSLYGTTIGGGSYDASLDRFGGAIFKVNPDGSGYSVLHSFGVSLKDGLYPMGELAISGTTLYGATRTGGSNGWGTVFEISTDGSGYAILKHFAQAEGYALQGGVTVSGAVLYGTAAGGGSHDQGTVFKINTDGSGFTVLKQFSGSDGANPLSTVVVSGDTLYGTTARGGISGNGTVFRINTDGTGFAVLKDFGTLGSGNGPTGKLVLSGSTLYGTRSQGSGGVFKINTDGAGFAVLKDFAGVGEGWCPSAGLVLYGSTLYGTTAQGKSDNEGTVFKLNTDGSDFSVLHRFVKGSYIGRAFTNEDGAWPEAAVLLSGDTLYGTASSGGNYGGGAAFELKIDGSGFAVLKEFSGPENGAKPLGKLAISGTTLYGATERGGRFGTQSGLDMPGTIFRVDIDGEGFRLLKSFAGGSEVEGERPCSGLVPSGTVLYGTTDGGGTGYLGTVFRINTDGANFTILRNFADDHLGANPRAELLLSGSTLYGTTSGGGALGKGTVFKINTDGSGFAVLHHFTSLKVPSLTNPDGAWPQAGLLLSGSTLYGAAVAGGRYGHGTIFGVNIDGSGFTTLRDFTANDGGSAPSGDLVLAARHCTEPFLVGT